MDHNRARLRFNVDLANIELAIRSLYRDKAIDEKTFLDFVFQVRTAITMDELREFSYDLSHLVKNKRGTSC